MQTVTLRLNIDDQQAIHDIMEDQDFNVWSKGVLFAVRNHSRLDAICRSQEFKIKTMQKEIAELKITIKCLR